MSNSGSGRGHGRGVGKIRNGFFVGREISTRFDRNNGRQQCINTQRKHIYAGNSTRNPNHGGRNGVGGGVWADGGRSYARCPNRGGRDGVRGVWVLDRNDGSREGGQDGVNVGVGGVGEGGSNTRSRGVGRNGGREDGGRDCVYVGVGGVGEARQIIWSRDEGGSGCCGGDREANQDPLLEDFGFGLGNAANSPRGWFVQAFLR